MKSRNTIFSESKRGQLTGLLNELPYLLYEVLDPPELRDELRTIYRRAIARFAGGEEKFQFSRQGDNRRLPASVIFRP